MGLLGRYLRLSRWRRSLLTRALVLLPVIDVLLRVLGYAKTRALLSRTGVCATPQHPKNQDVLQQDICWAVLAASRHGPTRPTCLRRSLLIAHFLQSTGIDADIKFGARGGSDGFEAHAWVESNGQVVGEDPEATKGFLKLERTGR